MYISNSYTVHLKRMQCYLSAIPPFNIYMLKIYSKSMYICLIRKYLKKTDNFFKNRALLFNQISLNLSLKERSDDYPSVMCFCSFLDTWGGWSGYCLKIQAFKYTDKQQTRDDFNSLCRKEPLLMRKNINILKFSDVQKPSSFREFL